MEEVLKSKNKIVFLEGLPGVGKTTILNKIKQKNISNVYTVDEIIVDLQEKTPVNQDIFIINDNQKINMYNYGIIVIDRGPISTLSYNQTRHLIDKSFSNSNVEKWFKNIQELYNKENVEVVYLTTKGQKYYLPFKNNKDPYGSIENQRILENVAIENCKKYAKKLHIIEYHQKNMEEIIYEIIN